jgi:hypothetical protein
MLCVELCEMRSQGQSREFTASICCSDATTQAHSLIRQTYEMAEV